MENLADNGDCYVITEKFTGSSFSDGVTGHGFQTNVSCIPGALKSGELQTSDVEGNAVKSVQVHGAAEVQSVGTKAELRASAQTALIDQDDQDETIIVETASEDADDESESK